MKLLPVIVTVVPTGPDGGVKETIVGTCEKRVCANNNMPNNKIDLVLQALSKARILSGKL